MNSMNEFWVVFAAIGQAVGAVATAAAVVVALWQTKYANRKRLKLIISYDNIAVKNDGDVVREFVNLSVTNMGNRNVVVEEWGIYINRHSRFAIVNDGSDAVINMLQRKLPFTLEPEDRIDLAYEKKRFLSLMEKQVVEGRLSKKNRVIFYIKDSTGKLYFTNNRKKIEKLLLLSKENIV